MNANTPLHSLTAEERLSRIDKLARELMRLKESATALPWDTATYAQGVCPPLGWREAKTRVVFADGDEPGDVALISSRSGDGKAIANMDYINACANNAPGLAQSAAALKRVCDLLWENRTEDNSPLEQPEMTRAMRAAGYDI